MLEPHPEYPNLFVHTHPAIQHKITRLRDERTDRHAFRSLTRRIASLMVYEATRELPIEPVDVRTPLEATTGVRLRGSITIVPILRAGLGMSEGVLDLLPEARVGVIGMARNEETLEPAEYLANLPRNLDAGPVLVLDPMLATGGSSSAAMAYLRKAGAADMRFLCLVAAPEGVRRLLADHPGVPIHAAALDERLDERGYIRPGLGDAGDRLFGTG
ncbi:MAG: uracil phosphoribosyltransferase [Phycisphaeraceae bacterium]|nr:uracil phosphoribosyltransferase [Phycisphaeraceae bacterium]MCB9847820.1 uracil phosphoribosyltransferase [Phycisphaeraceae bacterium]